MAKKIKRKKAKQVKQAVIPKILIGVPILAWTHEFATSFLEFWTDLMTYKRKGFKFHISYKFMYRKPVHMAEEELAEFALQCDCTHLLLMDDDIYNVKASDLIALVDADKDVVGGIMHASGFPFAMCAFRRFDRKTKVADQPILTGPARLYEVPEDQRTGLQRVDLIPFAFTLFKMHIFKNLKKPWFKCDTQAPTDSWFADRILDKKLEYYAHFDVWLNHRGITRGNRPLQFQLALYNQQTAGGKQIIQLTPEEMKRHEAYMTLKLQDAEKAAKVHAIGDQVFYEKSPKRDIGKRI